MHMAHGIAKTQIGRTEAAERKQKNHYSSQ